MVLTPPMGTSTDIPTDWDDAIAIQDQPTGSLLEAFCQGAGFDSSAPPTTAVADKPVIARSS